MKLIRIVFVLQCLFLQYLFSAPMAYREPAPWPNGLIPFKISNSFNKMERDLITVTMEQVETATCVQFVPTTTEATYLDVVKQDNRPCSSFIGYRDTGARQLYLQHHCMNKNDILHELMHVLGFNHEHNRYDRDRYVTVVYSNIQEKMRRNFQKRPFLEHVLVGIGYDFNSVTHFPSHAYAKNQSSPTIIPLSGDEIKMDGLSRKDILKINRYYQCNQTRATTI